MIEEVTSTEVAINELNKIFFSSFFFFEFINLIKST